MAIATQISLKPTHGTQVICFGERFLSGTQPRAKRSISLAPLLYMAPGLPLVAERSERVRELLAEGIEPRVLVVLVNNREVGWLIDAKRILAIWHRIGTEPPESKTAASRRLF